MRKLFTLLRQLLYSDYCHEVPNSDYWDEQLDSDYWDELLDSGYRDELLDSHYWDKQLVQVLLRRTNSVDNIEINYLIQIIHMNE